MKNKESVRMVIRNEYKRLEADLNSMISNKQKPFTLSECMVMSSDWSNELPTFQCVDEFRKWLTAKVEKAAKERILC